METLTPQNPCYSTQLVLGTLSGDCTFDLKMQGGWNEEKKVVGWFGKLHKNKRKNRLHSQSVFCEIAVF